MKVALASGHTVHRMHEEEEKRLVRDFPPYKPMGGVIKLNPGNFFLLGAFEKFADKVYNFEFRSDDILVMTFPKCGTTWTQEIVWTMINNPDLNNPEAETLPIIMKAPFLESDFLFSGFPVNPAFDAIFSAFCPGKDPKDGMMIQMADTLPPTRTTKTHLPFSFFKPSLLDTSKVIFVSRNPYDCAVSYYHHSKLIKGHDYCGSFDDFVNYFVNDDVMFGPYWKMIDEVIERMDQPNLHIIKYEEMIKNPMNEIQRLDTFMDTNLTKKQMENVLHYTSFAEMKKREEVSIPSEMVNNDVKAKDGGFFRKGKSGTGKLVMTESQKYKIDIWTKKNTIGRKALIKKVLAI